MRLRLFTLASLLIVSLLSGCGQTDPQAALEAAVQQLQDNLENKQTNALLEQLHAQFSAEQQYDREWAKRTLLMVFLRHQKVSVIAFSKTSQIDPTYPDRGNTEAEIAVTGASGLIPDDAAHYHVQLQWWLEDGEWQLARLNWR
ncbi:MAG: hypothetical protein K2Y25_04475 [Pseudomonadaceae bacterium]|jgi:hypothetical protein|nr:hypothetical protein [Pseudomonadaceae bacterium]